MKRTYKHFLSLSLTLCFLMFSGCQASPGQPVEPQAFHTETGFAYPGLAFGLSLDEAETITGLDLHRQEELDMTDTQEENGVSVTQAYFSRQSEAFGKEGMLVLQFRDEALWAATFRFDQSSSVQDLKALADSLKQDFVKEFGDPGRTQSEDVKDYTGSTLQWTGNDGTLLSLTTTSQGDTVTNVSIGAAMPQQAPAA